jgi:hypothetical protein
MNSIDYLQGDAVVVTLPVTFLSPPTPGPRFTGPGDEPDRSLAEAEIPRKLKSDSGTKMPLNIPYGVKGSPTKSGDSWLVAELSCSVDSGDLAHSTRSPRVASAVAEGCDCL